MDERLLAADDSRWVGTKCIIDHTVSRGRLHRDFGEPHARPRSNNTRRDGAILEVDNLRDAQFHMQRILPPWTTTVPLPFGAENETGFFTLATLVKTTVSFVLFVDVRGGRPSY
jgi:hypothetical protein